MGAVLTPQDAREPGGGLPMGSTGTMGVIAGREGSPASSASLGAAGPVLSWHEPREGGEARAPARLCRWPGRWPAAGAERSGNLTGDGSWSVSSDWGSLRPEGPGLSSQGLQGPRLWAGVHEWRVGGGCVAVRGGGFPKAGEAGWSWVSEVLDEVDLTLVLSSAPLSERL